MAASIYGLVAIAALLAAESGRYESYPDTVLSAALAACIYWLLHAYSHILGSRISARERLSLGHLRRALARDRALLSGAAIPVAALLLSWAGGASQATAVAIALWSAVVSLIALEIAAGLRANASPGELALDTAIGLTMGLGLIAMRALLQH